MSINQYNNSCIYKIYNDNNSLFYIGSTFQSIERRFKTHKSLYKRYNTGVSRKFNSAFLLLNDPTCKIEILEHINVETKSELLKKEREYYDRYKNTIVNMNRPFTNDIENKELVKKHNTDRNFKFITCDICNKDIKRRYKKTHPTSKEHINNMNNNVNNNIV